MVAAAVNHNGRRLEFTERICGCSQESEETCLLRYGWTETSTDPVSGFRKPLTVVEDMEKRIFVLYVDLTLEKDEEEEDAVKKKVKLFCYLVRVATGHVDGRYAQVCVEVG